MKDGLRVNGLLQKNGLAARNGLVQSHFSFTPGFSPVEKREVVKKPFQRFLVMCSVHHRAKARCE
jgi:hypothetical protein